MGRDALLLTEMELLIDGELDRGRRIGLLARIAGDDEARATLAEAVSLDSDLKGLNALYDAADPSPDALPRLYAALTADRPRSSISSVLSGLGAAAQKFLTPLDDARLASIIAGSDEAPPDADRQAPPESDVPRRDASINPAPQPSDAVGVPREIQPINGRYAFHHGAGALVAPTWLTLVDLGDIGPRETGAWALTLQAGTVETVSAGRIEIHAAPTVAGSIVLLDGSSLSFKAPLAITWEFAG